MPLSSGTKVEFELWDNDTFDPDDFLGKFTMDCYMVDNDDIQEAHFNAGSAWVTLGGYVKSGAYYILRFKISSN